MYVEACQEYNLLQTCSRVTKEMNQLELEYFPMETKEFFFYEDERERFTEKLKQQLLMAQEELPQVRSSCDSHTLLNYFERHVEELRKQLVRVQAYNNGFFNQYLKMVEAHSLERHNPTF